MRILLSALLSLTFLCTKAQSHLPVTNLGYGYAQFPFSTHDSGRVIRPWQLKPYASLSAGYIFFNGGISYLSAPMGLMLLHPLNSNVSAFAGVSVAPTFFSINRMYTDPSYPGNGFSNRYGLGLSGRVEGGLIYTNDAKTFSISGSVGIERSSYPVYSSPRTNVRKQ